MKDKDGNRLYRKVVVKIVFPNETLPVKYLSQRADPRRGFGPAGIDDILHQVADQLDTLYPFWEFKPIEIASVNSTAKYVFTFAGYRSVAQTEVQYLDPKSIQEVHTGTSDTLLLQAPNT